jgi:hypothetical protein
MTAHLECAARQRPGFEIGDIVRRHRDALERARLLNVDQRRALSALALCRTEALGGHLEVCTACGHTKPSYNSCRNRHCPKCQSLTQEKWVVDRLARILPVQHFHVVFTLPAALRSLAAYRPALVYNLLFETASAALLEVGRGPKLGALLGITAVLHTWTRELQLHPHLHCIVTAGGIMPGGGDWIRSRSHYLLPVRVLSDVFRGKFLAALRREHRRASFAGFDAFADPEGFERLCSSITKHRWVVYAKKPFAGPQHIFRYLGRYTHRVGIANSRIVDVGDDHVTFRTKDGKAITLSPIDFLARFVQHILPKGFVKIRHFGIYASAHVHKLLEHARALLPPPRTVSHAPPPMRWFELLLALTGRDVRRCPRCGGPIESLPLCAPQTSRNARSPPDTS